MRVHVELRAAPPGDVRFPARADHAISVHAGAPVRVSCASPPCARSIRTRGDIYLMPAGFSDEWIEDDAASSVELHMPAPLLALAAEEMGLDPDRAGIQPRFDFQDAHIEHIAWALEADTRAGFPSGQLYGESLSLALAVHLLAGYRAPSTLRSGLARRTLQHVLDHVEEHLGRDLSLARLAAVAGLSTSHFKTLFRRSMGVPVHEYVIRRRVERARSLLIRGDLPAGQIALEVGFSHQSHMARHMRRILGVTPTSLGRVKSS